MGIPISDMSKIREWIVDIGNGFDTLTANEVIKQKQRQAMLDFLDYIRAIIKDEDEISNKTVLYSLIQAKKEGQLNEDELLSMVGFVFLSGHETTISLIGNGLWLLLSHPEQWELLIKEPDMISQAIEEILRFESPLQRSSFRIVTETVNINGNVMQPGDQISVVIAAANRDENIFVNPNRFDIRRDVNPHIAFGLGVHNCVGKQLARIEARIAFERIIARLPHMKLQSTIPIWRRNTFFRSLDELWVTL